MREILFRGKRVDNCEWVYGYYVEAKHSWHNHGVHKDWIICSARANGGWFCLEKKHAVIPETVGQYTGLTDKNGTKIFEGDIVKHDFGDEQIREQYAVVNYDCKYASFMIIPINDWMYCDKSDCEVIGNIHDNPELLKEV